MSDFNRQQELVNAWMEHCKFTPKPGITMPTDHLYDMCGRSWRTAGVDMDQYERDNDHFPYIPFRPKGFVERINAITKVVGKDRHFIDVGCGIGDKLFFAHKYCGIKKVSGIEYNAKTFAFATQHLSDIAANLVHDDAFNIDFSPYNLIYFYMPIRNYIRMRDLFIHVAETAPDGAVLAEMLPGYLGEQRKKTPPAIVRNLTPAQLYRTHVFQKRDGELFPLDIQKGF